MRPVTVMAGGRRWSVWVLGMVAAVAGLAAMLTVAPGYRTYRPPDDRVPIPTGAGSIARGKHLVEAVAVCTICHGDDLGGTLAFDDPLLGRGYTANLTGGAGGIGRRYSVQDWVRSIRYGVRPDGRGIAFMPSDHYNIISDADLGAVIAYLRGLAPVNNERTMVELNPLARLLIALGAFGEVDRTARIDMTAPRSPLPGDAGAYLIAVGGCTFCHGATLQGGAGPEPGAPPAPDLTGAGPLRSWSLAKFLASMRSGIAADGHPINPKYMPWRGYRHMTDAELGAIWRGAGHVEDEPPGRQAVDSLSVEPAMP